ncbi:MAG TPA: sensor histidine kinase [Xanthomonadaceae bacterium]|nr:sensor histidine kinase [Xanthomonadaceae bacterium]
MPTPPREWLPDFCRLPALVPVMVAAQTVVLLLALAPTPAPDWDWRKLVAASLFSQWLALTGAVLLCVLRPYLLRLPLRSGMLLAWALPVAAAMVGALLVHEVDLGLGLGLTLPAGQRYAFVAGCGALTALIAAVALRYFYVQQQWRGQVQAQAKSEVEALQARIRPHFLFNSMNTIASLVRRDPAVAERAIEDLSDLFRAALGAGQGEGTLGEEIELANSYLQIERHRFGERLQVVWDLHEPLPRELPMPRLILQPLVENAVVHGIGRLTGGGEVRIRAASEKGRLHIAITNPSQPPRERDARVGHGHAHESIAQRLRYHFGPGARMTGGYADGYYCCVLELPLP